MNENCEEKIMKKFEFINILKTISDELPKNELVSAYTNKENNKELIIILRKSKIIPTFQEIIEKNIELLKSENMNVTAYSLWELEKKKKTKFKNQIKEDPKIFLDNLEKYKLIYGDNVKSNL